MGNVLNFHVALSYFEVAIVSTSPIIITSLLCMDFHCGKDNLNLVLVSA